MAIMPPPLSSPKKYERKRKNERKDEIKKCKHERKNMNENMKLKNANLMIALCGDLEITAQDRRNLSHSAVGGVILFARNFRDSAQLRQLNADIRRAAAREILIAADQEGGRVQRFCGGDFVLLPAAAELRTAEAAKDAGMIMAAGLRAAGVDLSFAPVLDLAHGRSQVIGTRAFAADGDLAAANALAFAAGMRAAGMECCGKHFPGHGYASADSHETLPIDEREFAEIAAADLIPFAKWAAAKMPALMTAHIVFPKCDAAAATFSSFWLQEVLRKQLRFDGLIIGDDLTMEGADIGGIGERMHAALTAGCEGLLICKPEAVSETLAEIVTPPTAKNPWLKLTPKPDNITNTGTPEYTAACGRLLG